MQEEEKVDEADDSLRPTVIDHSNEIAEPLDCEFRPWSWTEAFAIEEEGTVTFPGTVPARTIKTNMFTKPFPFYQFFTQAKFEDEQNERAKAAGIDDGVTGKHVRIISRAWIVLMLTFVFVVGIQGLFKNPPFDHYIEVDERSCAECHVANGAGCDLVPEEHANSLLECEQYCSEKDPNWDFSPFENSTNLCNFAYWHVEKKPNAEGEEGEKTTDTCYLVRNSCTVDAPTPSFELASGSKIATRIMWLKRDKYYRQMKRRCEKDKDFIDKNPIRCRGAREEVDAADAAAKAAAAAS